MTFELYLRTGRRVALAPALETKFNPWHDPDDGRFTFAGQGTYLGGSARGQKLRLPQPVRSAGGSFGGGGAGGSWEQTRAIGHHGTGRDGGSGRVGAIGISVSQAAGQRSRASVVRQPARARTGTAERPASAPRLTLRKNGYDFAIDAHARTRRVTGEIGLDSQPRSRRAQSDAGKRDRRRTDDGGHYIAARFNGPREWFNHFAQDVNFNRGAYRSLEDTWAKAVRAGGRVFVEIVPHYHDTSMRPHLLTIRWTVNGNSFKRDLPNEKQGK